MNKKKTIIAALVLLLLLAIGGVMAYFTDKEEVKNTFTVGKVDITLTEPNWNAENAKNLVPGAVVDKNPTVTVAADSADAYVFVKVDVPCVGTGTTRREVFTYDLDAANWSELTEAEKTCAANAVATHVYAHNGAMAAEATATLFTKVTLDANLTQEEANGLTLEMPVNAYAIQKANVGGATYSVWNTNFNS